LPLRPDYRNRANWSSAKTIAVDTLLIVFDLGGTFVFALSGATLGGHPKPASRGQLKTGQ
jgi:hypothetical protein